MEVFLTSHRCWMWMLGVVGLPHNVMVENRFHMRARGQWMGSMNRISAKFVFGEQIQREIVSDEVLEP